MHVSEEYRYGTAAHFSGEAAALGPVPFHTFEMRATLFQSFSADPSCGHKWKLDAGGGLTWTHVHYTHEARPLPARDPRVDRQLQGQCGPRECGVGMAQVGLSSEDGGCAEPCSIRAAPGQAKDQNEVTAGLLQ
ncbi:hypothetical protein P7K49_024744 [Saguinus oedipus]|uniref:Uncharacterized protein n=1 Tax=Saguinus oedipus TaxID=9490 RepID=A0ABQ9US06_SAGOE|nr:hypothetical protein P7K49_024744 [Saguinus oedipus]